MKKVLIVLAVVCLVAFPVMAGPASGVTAKNSIGVGLNLGTNTGVGMRFGMGNFDVLANVGFDLISLEALAGDVAVSYNVYTIDGGRQAHFPITVGAGVKTALHFDPVAFDLDIVFPVGIEYNFAQLNPNVPITLYFRLAPGFQLLDKNNFDFNFAIAGYIGALWNF